jgi:hypothetical protein
MLLLGYTGFCNPMLRAMYDTRTTLLPPCLSVVTRRNSSLHPLPPYAPYMPTQSQQTNPSSSTKSPDGLETIKREPQAPNMPSFAQIYPSLDPHVRPKHPHKRQSTPKNKPLQARQQREEPLIALPRRRNRSSNNLRSSHNRRRRRAGRHPRRTDHIDILRATLLAIDLAILLILLAAASRRRVPGLPIDGDLWRRAPARDLPRRACEALDAEPSFGPFAAGGAGAVERAETRVDGALVRFGAEFVGGGGAGAFGVRAGTVGCAVVAGRD